MLQKVSIQNFKSLKDVTLELQKVNLLIGPNNSGKSNFLKALELWGKYIYYSSKENQFFLNSENYFFKGKERASKVEITENSDIFTYNMDRESNYKFFLNGVVENALRRTEDIEKFRNVAINFKDIRIYKIIPDNLNVANPISGLPNQYLLSDGSNIVPFLDYLKDEHKSSYRKLEQDLNKCIPEFKEVNLRLVTSPENDARTYKKWGLGNDDEKYWAEDLSEGVLYFLALLCIVHQPNPPKLLLLEEPEKGIHPRRIHEVMKFIFQLAEDRDIQVIMTSHNEHVLQEFRLNPASVFIFDKDEEGATFVKNLQKDVIEPDTQKAQEFGIEPINYLDNMGESWFMGLIGGVPA